MTKGPCSKCGETNRSPSGRCRPCQARIVRRWQAANPEKCRESERKYKKTHPIAHLLKGARTRAKREGVPFDIAIDNLIAPELCPYLGLRLLYGGGTSTRTSLPESASLDRINPELGYVKGNVEVISTRANSLKGGGSLAFLEMVVARMRRARQGS